MLSTIIVSALACAASIGVAVALLIYVRSALSHQEVKWFASCSATRDTLTTLYELQRKRLDEVNKRLTDCETGLKQTSGTHLAGELGALAADIDSLARGTRKQFGKVWAELQHDGTIERNEARQQPIETPEEVRERLRLEHGLPKLVGGNGAVE